MTRQAWFCPSCQKHHAPHCDTCPGPSGQVVTPGVSPAVSPPNWTGTPLPTQPYSHSTATWKYDPNNFILCASNTVN